MGFKLDPPGKILKTCQHLKCWARSKHVILQGLHPPSIHQKVSTSFPEATCPCGLPATECLESCWIQQVGPEKSNPPERCSRAHTPNAHRDPAPQSDYSRLLGESAETPRKSQTGRFRLHPPCPGGFCRNISERCRRLVSTAVVQLVLPA